MIVAGVIMCIVKTNCTYGNECSANMNDFETWMLIAYTPLLISGACLVLLIPHLLLQYKALLPGPIYLPLGHFGSIR